MAGGLLAPQRPLGGADHARVVRAGQPAVGRDDHEADLADLLTRHEERVVEPGAALGEVADDLGDLLAVGTGGGDALLGANDAAGGDQLHGARDLLGRLDAADAALEDPLLAAGHG